MNELFSVKDKVVVITGGALRFAYSLSYERDTGLPCST